MHTSPTARPAHARALLSAALLTATLAAVPAAPCAVFVPDVFVDLPDDPSDGKLTLREAVSKANAAPGKDVIQLGAGHYELTSGTAPSGKAAYWTGDGLLEVTDDLEIVGKGASATTLRMLPGISGTRDRFLQIAPGVSVQVKAVGIGAGGWGGHAGLGGAVLNAGKLTLRDCYVAHNSASIAGGAVLNRGQLEVFDCVFQYNEAGRDGGAIFNDAFATATINTSDFTVNSAGGSQQTYGGHGGALFNALAATATVRNSSMSSNHAYGTVSGHGGFGGAIFNFWGTVSVINNGVVSNYAHRLVSPGWYHGFVEDFGGTPVWSYYEMAPLPPPWPPHPWPWP